MMKDTQFPRWSYKIRLGLAEVMYGVGNILNKNKSPKPFWRNFSVKW